MVRQPTQETGISIMLTTTTSIQAEFAADHDRLDQSFASYRQVKRSSLARARDLFHQFKLGLQRHIAWEEEVLFPLFEQKTGMVQVGPIPVMRREHRHIRAYLDAVDAKLRNDDPSSENEEWGLLAALAVHNEKEEKVLYPTLDRLLSDAEKAEAFTAMARLPEELSPHAAEPQPQMNGIALGS
jgi:hemerythrin-like domain-containing protein